jgi:hypothetical protein
VLVAIETVPPAVPAGTVIEVAVPPGGGFAPVLTVVGLVDDAVPEAVEGGGLPACGVTWFEADEGGPVPIAFVAFTVNVYVVPFVSDEIDVVVVDPLTVVAAPLGLAVTV